MIEVLTMDRSENCQSTTPGRSIAIMIQGEVNASVTGSRGPGFSSTHRTTATAAVVRSMVST
jgi:hypothetical protein